MNLNDVNTFLGMNVDTELRKLRKKLRDIERLECRHNPTSDETMKLGQKSEIQLRVAEIIESQSRQRIQSREEPVGGSDLEYEDDDEADEVDGDDDSEEDGDDDAQSYGDDACVDDLRRYKRRSSCDYTGRCMFFVIRAVLYNLRVNF